MVKPRLAISPVPDLNNSAALHLVERDSASERRTRRYLLPVAGLCALFQGLQVPTCIWSTKTLPVMSQLYQRNSASNETCLEVPACTWPTGIVPVISQPQESIAHLYLICRDPASDVWHRPHGDVEEVLCLPLDALAPLAAVRGGQGIAEHLHTAAAASTLAVSSSTPLHQRSR